MERARRDAKEFSKLNRRERRTEAQTRKLRDKKPSASRMVRGLVAKSRALATFVPFPLELEKLRLLGN